MVKNILSIVSALSCAQAIANSQVSTYFEPPTASIPAGSFMAKNHAGEGRYKVIMQPFQMAKYELTVAEFRKFVEDTGYKAPTNCMHEIGPGWFGAGEKDGSWDNNFFNLSEYHPVVCIGITGAEDYAKWLSNKTGKQYELMSEAQWLYVMKTGGYDEYISEKGKKRHQVCEIANLADQHANAMTGKIYQAPYSSAYTIEDCNDKEILSSTVGLYKADKYGVHDLLGNIQEVVADCYIDGKQGFPQGGGPVTQANCTSRIAKGSSWHWEVPDLDRRGEMADDFIAAIEGFRLVLNTKGKVLPAQTGNNEFVMGLAQAQKQAKVVHAQIAEYPTKVSDLSLHEKEPNVVLTWKHSRQSLGTTYKITRLDLVSNHEKVIAQGITELKYVDTKPSKNKARYTVTAQVGEREGLVSNTVDSNTVITHNLPARIQAEAFSKGAAVNVRNSSQEPKHDLVFINMRNTSADYQVKVTKAGKYTLEPRVFHSGDKQTFSVFLNGQLLKEITTTGEDGWQTASAVPVTLPKGTHVLTIKPMGERTRFSINWLDVKKL
ncbi:SUMF1/EgtB/PvdO family nonheme iron enzyme [Pseudoalteromonas phenolica]|uniref:CBM6 domain-containing protein n=1 Tax=Pseudoalteromonas phenolica TaxID=161398 RepID=A0A0S2JZ13_9GAMM|nr:SUMF1/EgtB/PvdO family nonheme iron enzyme [Pseudoalteromonas phenolica]ALO41309.1 hypothetical protein PP2015_790 [Pseudoalteromonas phenolica]MBE0354151.1 hypothetical protein [Pseudoalteromonas phenolica O-BC30]